MPDWIWLRIATLCVVAQLAIIGILLHRIAESLKPEENP